LVTRRSGRILLPALRNWALSGKFSAKIEGLAPQAKVMAEIGGGQINVNWRIGTALTGPDAPFVTALRTHMGRAGSWPAAIAKPWLLGDKGASAAREADPRIFQG
ncbi:MAG: hypothetical protein KIT76_17770, partial [Pseudolabrys sp.]|nr:hypothetical protein [Pseudolabrys sp.]